MGIDHPATTFSVTGDAEARGAANKDGHSGG